MIIFLYGTDTYRSKQKLNEIIEHYKNIHKSGLNLKYYDGKTINFEEFKNEIQSVSMFAEKKLIVLKEVFSNQNFKEDFLKNSKEFLDSNDIILFYETNQISGKDSLFNFLIRQAKCQEFKLLESQKLKNWIKKEFERYQASIEPKALDQLINYVGNDLWQMANEIKKLTIYKKRQKIELKDIELLVRPKIESDIFKTIDALSSKDKKIALKLIYKHLEKGESPLYLLTMINFQFRNLLIVKSLQLRHQWYPNLLQILTEKLGIHPYIIKKTIQQVRQFTFEELKKIYQKIFEADLNIKTGKLDPYTALDLLIAEI